MHHQRDCQGCKNPPGSEDEGYVRAYQLYTGNFASYRKVWQKMHHEGWPLHNYRTAGEWVAKGRELREAEIGEWLNPLRLRERLLGYSIEHLERLDELRIAGASKEQLATIEAILAVVDRIAKLGGANAPTVSALISALPGVAPGTADKIMRSNGGATGGDVMADSRLAKINRPAPSSGDSPREENGHDLAPPQ